MTASPPAAAAKPELPLPATLLVIGERTGGRDGRALRRLAEQLMGGASLDDAPALGTLSPRLSLLLETGRRTGALLPLLRTERELAAERDGGRQRLIAALAYPMLVFICAALLAYPIARAVVSGVGVFDMDDWWGPASSDHWVTAAMQAIVDYAEWLLVIPAVAGVVVCWALFAPLLPITRRVHQRLLASLPLTRRIMRARRQSELAAFAAVLVEAGQPLPEAWTTAGQLVDVPGGDRLGRRIAQPLAAGQSLDDSLSKARLTDWVRDLPLNPSPPQLATFLRRRAESCGVLAAIAIDLLLLWIVPVVFVGVGLMFLLLLFLLATPMIQLRVMMSWLF